MRSSLEKLLKKNIPLLADGATGTSFMSMGLEPGFPPDLWNISHPEKPSSLHRSFADAGSDIILTNTFGANRPRLKLHNAESETYAINKAGAKIAGWVAENSKREIVVGGSVGPTGELFEPMGELTMKDCIGYFEEQIQGLKDGGADLAWIETMSSTEEIEAAARAAIKVGIPYVFTASFDTAGRTMMGIKPSKIHEATVHLTISPLAYGANCGVGASDMVLSILEMTSEILGAVIIGKANCGIPVVKGKETIYSGTPELMAEYTSLAINAGAKIIGGCCGTAPEHISHMRSAIDNHVASNRPSMEQVIEKLGSLASPPAKEGAKGSRGKRNRGRQ